MSVASQVGMREKPHSLRPIPLATLPLIFVALPLTYCNYFRRATGLSATGCYVYYFIIIIFCHRTPTKPPATQAIHLSAH